jgi:hypothetical protein
MSWASHSSPSFMETCCRKWWRSEAACGGHRESVAEGDAEHLNAYMLSANHTEHAVGSVDAETLPAPASRTALLKPTQVVIRAGASGGFVSSPGRFQAVLGLTFSWCLCGP